MGFRVRQSGGFWNGVDGVIIGYKFSNRAPKAGGVEGDQTDWVSFVPTVLVDGKKAPETQHMKLGGVEEWDISEDGLTATNRSGNNDPSWVTAAFLGSLAQAAEASGVDAQLPDTEGGEPLNLAGIVGLRVRLEQQVDEAAKGRGYARKSKRDPKKTFDPTNTIVTKVYGRAEQAAAGKTTTPAKGKSTSKSNGNAKTVDLDEKARDIVLNLLAEAKGATTKNKIRVPVINLTASNPELAPYRSDLQSRIFDDAFLSNIEGIAYDCATGAIAFKQ